MEIRDSDCFAITCKESGYLLAGFIIAVSKFYRGHGAMADPFVIVKRSERKQGLGEFTLRKATDFYFFSLYRILTFFCGKQIMFSLLLTNVQLTLNTSLKDDRYLIKIIELTI
jgi:hypothetical protein